MYAIYGNIYHQYTPNVSIYTIHGSYGKYEYVYVYIYLFKYIYIYIYRNIVYIYIYVFTKNCALFLLCTEADGRSEGGGGGGSSVTGPQISSTWAAQPDFFVGKTLAITFEGWDMLGYVGIL